MAHAEAINPAVLQEPADHGLDANVFRQSGNSGPQAANAAHDQLDRNAGLRCFIQRIDNVGIDQRVHLHPDRRRLAVSCEIGFAAYVVENPVAQGQRRHRHFLDVARLGVTGDVIEDACGVAADGRVRREVRQVGVDPRRHRMIVAGPGVNVGRETSAFPAHHHRQLGVRLQFDEAVNHLHAGAFEIARPSDVGLFVEPRLEFDERRDRLARLRRFGKRPHDRRVVGGAVERLLDRDDVRIARGLLQELHDDVERFIGMMNDQVLLPDRGEHIAAVIAHAFGMARNVGHEFEVGPVEPCQLRQLVHGQDAIHQQHFVVRGRQRPLHECTQLGRHRRFDFKADDGAATATFQGGFEQANQIFRLFLDLQFGVPDDAERALPLDGVAGEQPVDEQAGGAFKRDQPDGVVLARRRQPQKPVDLAGHADQRIHRLAVGGPRELKSYREAEARNERKRVRRIDGERRQQREDIVEKVIRDPRPLGLGDVLAVDQDDSDLGQYIAQIPPDRLLVVCEVGNGLVDERKLFGRRQPVRTALRDPFPHLRLDAGDADHKELVKVIGGNRQKTDAFERGMAGIDRLLEHPAIEMQPG